MTTAKIPVCVVCHEQFENWTNLALHIMTNKKTHRKSVKFASHVLADVKTRPQLQRAPKDPDYVPTEFGDKQREIATKILSGETRRLYTVCPQCKRQSDVDIPVEVSRNIWNDSGRVFVLCQMCRRE